MPEIKVEAVCPKCGEKNEFLIDVNAKMLSPNVRCKKKPFGYIACYRFTTDEISQFLIEKARSIVPNIRVTVIPRYTEKKRRHHDDNLPRASYASLLIAFSEEAMEDKQDFGWYGKIGATGSNIRFKKSLFDIIIKKYAYRLEDVESWLKDFRKMEYLEETLGMTEEFIRSIKENCRPRLITGNDEKDWVAFAARPELILQDMLTTIETGKLDGEIKISEVNPISKDLVEYLVYIMPKQTVKTQDPRVVELLSK